MNISILQRKFFIAAHLVAECIILFFFKVSPHIFLADYPLIYNKMIALNDA